MTDNAGYCMAVTAKRNGMRLLAIVLGESDGKVRNKETAELLDYGFNLYELEMIKKKGDILGSISIDKANINPIDIVSNHDVTVLKKKGEDKKNYKSDLRLNNLKLPINKGDEVGTLIVLDDLGNQIDKVSVTINQDIKKDNLLNIFLKVLFNVINGNLI